MRRAAWWPVLLVLASCAAKTDTSVLVTVTWSGSPDIFVLEFDGPTEKTRLPANVPSEPLGSGQTARILVSDDQVGKTLGIVVRGLNRDLVAKFEGMGLSPTIVKNEEVPLSVTLGRVESDAGVADAGTPDAGSPDSGVCFGPVQPRDAGGTGVVLVACNASGTSNCQFCGIAADRCLNGQCSCGGKGACPLGTRCFHTADGNAACVCDQASNCQGCCGGNACHPFSEQAADRCGTAGNECKACNSSSTCNSGLCVGTIQLCGAQKCASSGDCVAKGWPTCGDGTAGQACAACDITRSNGCENGLGACACGSGKQCAADEVCFGLADGGGVCRVR